MRDLVHLALIMLEWCPGGGHPWRDFRPLRRKHSLARIPRLQVLFIYSNKNQNVDLDVSLSINEYE